MKSIEANHNPNQSEPSRAITEHVFTVAINLLQARLLLRRLIRERETLPPTISTALDGRIQTIVSTLAELLRLQRLSNQAGDPEHIGSIIPGVLAQMAVERRTSRSQRERILELLLGACGNWVSLPHVQACAAQYNARVFELRRLGYRITNLTREVDGKRHSWFRLESIPTGAGTLDNVSAQPNLSAAIPDLSETASSFPEFGKLGPERYGVD